MRRSDYVEAAKWYEKAAEQGNVEAQRQLAEMYTSGTGVGQDDFEAVKWNRKAAEQGNAEAQYNLAQMYAKAKGVKRQSDVLAYMWTSLAAAEGYGRANSFQSTLGGSMTLADVENAKRLARICTESKYTNCGWD